MEERDYKVGLNDLGKYNKISNKGILRILEDTGGIESENAGYGINDIKKTRLSWVLLAWKVKVIKRPIYNEKVKARTWEREANKIFAFRDYQIFNEKGELCVIATSKWTLIDIKTLKLAGIPEEVRNAYKISDQKVFEDEIEKLKEPKTELTKEDYKVLRSQIDVNKHVHNLYYLDIAYEALPEEIYEQEEKDNIEIMYKKQIKLNDPIVCLYSNENNKNTVTIKSKDEKTLHAIISLN